MRRIPVLAMGLTALSFATAPSGRAEDLAPYQMVRSLQQVQERIAAGDQALLPMQRKLLEMTDARIRAASDAEFGEPLNRRALLIYAMSGGNPATIQASLAKLPPGDADRKLGGALLPYLQGDVARAEGAIAAADPSAYPAELASYAALVKGSILAASRPKDALALLDRARLLSPGTLVEEAALRRSVGLAVTLQEPMRFTSLAYRYAQAFIRSPYASQFADSFVDGVVVFDDRIDLRDVMAITAAMSAEQERVVYLRIARRAAIEGLTDLAALATAKAGEPKGDSRSALYASLNELTSRPAAEIVGRLASIDRTGLSAKDRRLLDAAAAVAAGMTAPIEGMARPSVAVEPARPDHGSPSPPATQASAEANGQDNPGRVDAQIADARRKLADIDAIIGAMPR